MNLDKFENRSDPFITEFTIRQNDKIVHRIKTDDDGTTTFSIRVSIINGRYSEWFSKVHIDLVPGNFRAEMEKPSNPGSELGREAQIPNNADKSFTFEADYTLPITDYPLESASHFMAYIYLLQESGEDGKYYPNLLLKSMIMRG